MSQNELTTTAWSRQRRKFTREFKHTVARRVADGARVKQVAREFEIDPAVVRQWRDELRNLGADAFSETGKRRFTKEFKEAAVGRLQQGIPVKQVARDLRVDPAVLRHWRKAAKQRGADAFFDSEPKTKAIIFRLTEDEYSRLKAVAQAEGAPSLADFARSRVLYETSTSASAGT